MTTIDKQQDTSVSNLNLRHDQQYTAKLSVVNTNRTQKEEEHIENVLTEINEELSDNVEKKKRKAKADVEKDAKKDQVASSSRVANQTEVSQKQAPVLKAPERKLSQQETAPEQEGYETYNEAELDKSIAEETNFIAVMAESMTQGIRTGQMMFQFDWNESSSDWQNQLSHASVIESAMKQSGDAQSKATNEQSYRSERDGAINCAMAGLSLLMGLGGAAKEAYDGEKVAANKTAAEATDLDSSATKTAQKAEQEAAQTASKVGSELSDDASKVSKEAQVNEKAENFEANVDEENSDVKKKAAAEERLAATKGGSGPSGDAKIDDNARVKAVKTNLEKAGTVMKSIYEGFIKAAQIGVPLQMMAQGSCGVGVDAPSQAREADDQRDAAYAQAQSEALQLHASGYGEHYNKTEDARQSVSSAIKFFTDEFQSLPGTIVQALGTYHV